MYVAEIEHPGLLKHRVIRGRDRAVVARKAELQMAAWDEQWARTYAREAARAEKESKAAEAAARTEEAKQALRDLRSILSYTLNVDDTVDWNALRRGFEPPEEPPEPRVEAFAPSLSWLDHLLPFRKRRKLDESEARYLEALREWQLDRDEWRRTCERLQADVRRHNAAIDAQKSRYLRCDADAIAEYSDLVLSRSSYPASFPQEFQTDYENQQRLW
jgi:restriction system protein